MEEMKKLLGIALNLRELRTEYSRLNWVKFTTGFDFGIEHAYRELQGALKDPLSWETIQELKVRSLDPLDTRRVEIMELAFRPYHLSDRLNELSLLIQQKTNHLSSVLNTHRCTLDGKEVTSPEIARILSSEPDRETRRKAFMARAQVNRPLIEAGFLDLIELRKELASEYGSADFVQYKLEQQELDSAMFDGWTREVRDVLPLMDEVRSKHSLEVIGEPDPKPWDVTYITSGIAPELNRQVEMSDFFEPISELFELFGFDISGMNITYDIFPRKNKSEWGYNFPIESGVDSRILANVRDRYFQFGVLLHETGHALHSFVLNPEDVILNMGVSGIVSEGVANLFGRFRTDRLFFKRFFEDSVAVLETAAGCPRRSSLRRRTGLGTDNPLHHAPDLPAQLPARRSHV